MPPASSRHVPKQASAQVRAYLAALHGSLYPITPAMKRAHADALEGHETSRGTVRFPLTKPPPATLVKQLVKTLVAELRRES